MAAGNTGVARQRAWDAWNNARNNRQVPKETVDALKSQLDALDDKLEAETGTRQAGPFLGF